MLITLKGFFAGEGGEVLGLRNGCKVGKYCMGPRLYVWKCNCARVEEVQGVGEGSVQRHGARYGIRKDAAKVSCGKSNQIKSKSKSFIFPQPIRYMHL